MAEETGRLGSRVLDERYLIAASRYVELNPVRAMLIKLPWKYQWSSAAFHSEMREVNPLVRDNTLQGLVKYWREFLLQDESRANELRPAIRTGLPVGSEGFTPVIEKLTDRDLSRGKPGCSSKGRE